jgi:Rtf2 RING-finger
MRGAGTADHTGDLHRHKAQKFNAIEAMTTCALTKTPLFGSSNNDALIVADPHGTLYHKEAAVQALLRRKQQQDNNGDHENEVLGSHIRRLADLYNVRFHRENNVSTCPITGKALTGSIPAILLVPGKEATPNVVSESALKQLSSEELETEYGPINKRVRLAPPPTMLEEIKKQVMEEQEKEEEERRAQKAQKSAAKKKKRKHGDNNTENDGSKREEKKSKE